MSIVASAHVARMASVAMNSSKSSPKSSSPVAAPRAGLSLVPRTARRLSATSRTKEIAVIVPRAAAAPTDAATATPLATQPPTAIITGASSGLGLNAANALSRSGYHVIMACRDFAKAKRAAQDMNMDPSSYTVMHLDLASMDSVRQFADAFKASGRRLDCLVCNAAVYLPTAKEPAFTADGFELSVGTNHLGHFLLANLLLPSLEASPDNSPAGQPRMVIVGSITGNTNTMAGNVPPKADLGDLSGLASKASMIDGKEFDGAKAYKDSKVCNMLTMRELNKRFGGKSRVAFSSLYPGCIADTGLFRSHFQLFKTLFPLFQKYVTKGYVSQAEAGRRLAQVVSDPSMGKSGVYWSWSEKDGSFENQVSEEVSDDAKAAKLWEVSEKLVGL